MIIIKMNGLLFWACILSTIVSIPLLLIAIFQPINSALWLFSPLLAPIIILVSIIITINKEICDLIKSCNDSVLFLISAVTTALLIYKTIELQSNDIFNLLMHNRTGYIMVCFYSILFIIKASIAMRESYENYLKAFKKQSIFLA